MEASLMNATGRRARASRRFCASTSSFSRCSSAACCFLLIRSRISAFLSARSFSCSLRGASPVERGPNGPKLEKQTSHELV